MAAVRTFDGGPFSVTLNVSEEDWHVDPQPALSFIHFQKTGGVGFAGGAAFEGFVFLDRIQDLMPDNLEAWFAAYLKRRSGFLHTKVFDAPRNFRAAKNNPVSIDGHTLFRFDMAQRPLTRPASWTKVDEEGVVYFLLPPQFETHKTFFAFTGRQIVSHDLGQATELPEVENMIKGFKLTLSSQANQVPVPAPPVTAPAGQGPRRP